jgi:hypothetical protein
MKGENHGCWPAKLHYIEGEITKPHTNTLSQCGDFLVKAYKGWLKEQPYLRIYREKRALVRCMEQGHEHKDPPRVCRCHTPFRDSGNETSIRVPRMFHSHV